MKKAKEDAEKMKSMTPKEREEYKRLGTRLTGTQSSMSVVESMSMILV